MTSAVVEDMFQHVTSLCLQLLYINTLQDRGYSTDKNSRKCFAKATEAQSRMKKSTNHIHLGLTEPQELCLGTFRLTSGCGCWWGWPVVQLC